MHFCIAIIWQYDAEMTLQIQTSIGELFRFVVAAAITDLFLQTVNSLVCPEISQMAPQQSFCNTARFIDKSDSPISKSGSNNTYILMYVILCYHTG